MQLREAWEIPELDLYKVYESPALTKAGLYVPASVEEWDELQKWVLSLEEKGNLDEWKHVVKLYSANNLYYLLNYLLSDGKKLHNETNLPLYQHEFYRRYCNRTQYQLDNFISSIDCSARSLSKSTIRTKSSAIQLMIRYPNIAMVIGSTERQLAWRQMSQVVEELDGNKLLRLVHDDIFWWDPKEAAKNGDCLWSRADGIRVKRTISRMNSTLENVAFVGSAPVGSRYDVAFFEDTESEKHVGSKEAVDKLHDSLAAFSPLLTPVVIPKAMSIMSNTLYSSNGITKARYDELKDKGPAHAMLYTAEKGDIVNEKFIISEEGPCPGGGVPNYPFTESNLWTIFEAGNKNRANYYCQMLGDVTGGQDSTFKRDTILFSNDPVSKMAKNTNGYVCIDASRGLHDPMGIMVWGVANDRRFRWVGGLRKKLDPASPAFHDAIYNIVSVHDNLCDRVVEVRVEQFASQTWADLIRSELQKRGCYIPVIPCRNKVAEKTGQFRTSKMERIWSRWSPALQNGKIVFPKPTSMGGEGIMTHDEKGTPFDLVDHFLKHEYDAFPVPKHDDLLDAGSLIWEPEAPAVIYPVLRSSKPQSTSDFYRKMQRPATWMSAN